MNDTLNTKISQKIREMRSSNKFTQQDMADRLQIPRTTYANFEQSKREVSMEMLFKIIDICGYDATEVINELRKYVYKK